MSRAPLKRMALWLAFLLSLLLLQACSAFCIEFCPRPDPPLQRLQKAQRLIVEFNLRSSNFAGLSDYANQSRLYTGQTSDTSAINEILKILASQSGKWQSGAASPPIFQGKVRFSNESSEVMYLTFARSLIEVRWSAGGKPQSAQADFTAAQMQQILDLLWQSNLYRLVPQ